MANTEPTINKRQYAVVLADGKVEVYHFETDSDVVILPTGLTLSQWIAEITTYKKLVLGGGATGEALYNPAKPGNIELDVDITDDGHKHTGATVRVSEPLRVVTSGGDCDLVVTDVTTTELQCLKGVKSNIQTQIDELKALIEKAGYISTGDTPPEDNKAGDFWMENLGQAEG